MRAIRCFTIRATLPEPLAPLRDLMLNLRWSWHAETRDLFTALDPAGREEAGRDPITLLGEVPPEHLAQLATDEDYLGRLHRAAADLREYLSAARWYQQDGAAAGGRPAAIAYFSPEYGIAAALPQYSGGLGILAGDHLKAGSDLGVPLIGVGCSTGTATSASRCRRKGGSSSATRRVTPTACRSPCCAAATAPR